MINDEKRMINAKRDRTRDRSAMSFILPATSDENEKRMLIDIIEHINVPAAIDFVMGCGGKEEGVMHIYSITCDASQIDSFDRSRVEDYIEHVKEKEFGYKKQKGYDGSDGIIKFPH